MSRGTDFLRELWAVVLIGLAAVLIGTVIGLVDLLNGGPIHTLADMGVTADPGLADGVNAGPIGQVEVEIVAPTSWQRLLYALTRVPTAVVLLAALSLLAVTLHRARRTDPFTPKTVRDLRLTGIAFSAGLLASPIESFAAFALSETLTPDRFNASMQLPFGWFFGGFVCFAVAEIVRRGSGMRDYLETVV